MRQLTWWLVLAGTLALIGLVATPTVAQSAVVQADEASPTSQPSERAVALSTAGGLQVGEQALPGSTRYITYNPVDPARYARIDGIGLLRFVPESGQEGVYTFPPFSDGYTAESAGQNPLFVRQAVWSPNGRKLAFRIDNPNLPDASSGVWFWQPLQELASDPSYHILRNCPPSCDLAGTAGAGRWQAVDMEWAPDNDRLLVTVWLPDEGRRALEVRRAARDPEATQANTAVNPLRYEYGHWSLDGARLVVSGRGPDGTVVFGTVAPGGGDPVLARAADIGMAWVQDAVQQPGTGRLLMLASMEGRGGPLQIVDERGTLLTVPVGSGTPDVVAWSPDRSAVRIVTGGQTYIARVDGVVVDVTALASGVPVGWVSGGLPGSARALQIPPPLADKPPAPAAGAPPEGGYAVGQLLQVIVPELPVYAEPGASAPIIGTLTAGEELFIIGGPQADSEQTWWRIQGVDYTGWIRETAGGIPPLGMVANPP